jgi:hypothetical protein
MSKRTSCLKELLSWSIACRYCHMRTQGNSIHRCIGQILSRVVKTKAEEVPRKILSAEEKSTTKLHRRLSGRYIECACR